MTFLSRCCVLSLLVLSSCLGHAAAQEQPGLMPAGAFASDVPASAPTASVPSGFPGVNCAVPCEEGPRFSGKFIPYLLVPRMNGNVTVRGVQAPVEVTLGEMWDLFTHDLNMGFLGQLEVKYGRAGFLANGVYMDLSPSGEVRNVTFQSDYAQTALDLAFTYELGSKTNCECLTRRLELVAGVRYNSLNADLTVTGPLGNTASIGGARSWTDPIIGLRAEIPFSRDWTLQWRGDVGGFGINGCSQFTWNIEALLAYQCSDRTSVFAGYRWLDIDYSRGEFAYDMQIDGPMVGLMFRF